MLGGLFFVLHGMDDFEIVFVECVLAVLVVLGYA